MIRTRLLSAALVVLLVPSLASCGADEPEPEAVPTPTGSPFSFTLTGPDTAEPGETVSAELTNTGRLPDRFRLVPDPVGSATIAEPEVGLSPGESAQITMVLVDVPMIVRVQSISSGGEPDGDALSIGEVSD